MDIANVGAFLGGASQGVGQGMDLYAKYDQIAEQNRKRETEHKIAAKVAEMAQTGIFQNDPQGAMRQVGDVYAQLGDVDNMAKYHTAADDLQKKAIQRAGLLTYSTSAVSPQAAIPHLNDYNKAMGNKNVLEFVPGTGGGFGVKGMGADPNEVVQFANNDAFHEAALNMVAPGTFTDPKDALEFRRLEENAKQTRELQGAQVGLTHAETENTGERTISEREERPGKIAVLGAQANNLNTGATQNLASAHNLNAEAAATSYLTPLRGANIAAETDARKAGTLTEDMKRGAVVEGAFADVGATKARTEAQHEETRENRLAFPAKLQGANIGVAAGMVDLAAKQQELANLPAKNAADLEGKRAYADYLKRSSKGGARGEKLKDAIQPFIRKQDIVSGPIPFQYDETNVGTIAAAVADDTKVDESTAASIASQVLTDTKAKKFDYRNGVVTLSNGRQLKVGPNGVYAIKAIMQREKDRRDAAKAAG